MSTLTNDQVLHIAKLARLQLSETEVASMTKELSSILTWVEMLREVNTDDVEPTSQVTGLENALRDDVVRQSDASPDALLSCSPLPIADHQIQVPHAHG